MSEISVDRIMRNIYGTTATGQITNLSGGDFVSNRYIKQYADMRPQPNVRYLDSAVGQNGEQEQGPITTEYTMLGGARKTRKQSTKGKKNIKRRNAKAAEHVPIYASAEYMTDSPDLHIFIDKFFMYYRVSRSPNSAIYVVPPTKVLAEMVSKRGNYPEGSVEMQNAVRSNDKLDYDRYLFVTFGNNSKSDAYRIDPELTSQSAYPNSSFGTIRRTNVRGEVFYFTCDDNMKVRIHTTPKNASEGSEVKFIGRFNNGGYVFQGAIPPAAVEKIGPKKETKKRHHNINKMKFGEMPSGRGSAMIGGAVNKSLSVLEKYDDMYNGDHELAAEHFLRCVAKAGKLSEKYRTNGDLVYSAIYYALDDPAGIDEPNIGNETNAVDFVSSFKVTNRGDSFRKKVDGVINQLNRIYKRDSKQNRLSNFVESYKKIYSSNDIAKMTADITTGYLRNNDERLDAHFIENIYNSFENTQTSGMSLAALIKNALNSNPLPSAFGSEYMPVISKMNSFESDMKSKKYNDDDKEDFAEQIFSSNKKQDPEPKPEPEIVTQAELENQEDIEQDLEAAELDLSEDDAMDDNMNELDMFY